MRPDAAVIAMVSGLTQQGRGRDDWGNWFGCHNSRARMHYPLPMAALRRNPHAGLPVPCVNLPDGAEGNVVFPVSAPLERFNSPQSFGRITSGCGLGIYRDEVLGAGFYGDAFVCELVDNLVTRLKLTASGLTFSAERAAEERGREVAGTVRSLYFDAQRIAVDRQAEEGVRIAVVKLLGRGFDDPLKDGPVLAALLSPTVPSAVQVAALEQ